MSAVSAPAATEAPSAVRRPVARLRHELGGAAIYPLGALTAMNLLDDFDQAVYSLVGPEIVRHFNISAATYGLSFVPIIVFGMFVPVLMGWITDRVNRVFLSIVGALVWLVFALLTGVVPAFVLLLVVRMLAGIGKSVSEPAHNSLIADYYPLHGRGFAYAIHRNTYAVGVAVGTLAGGYIVSQYGWQRAFLIVPLPALVAIVMLFRLREPRRGHYERVADTDYADLPEPLKLRQSVKLLYNSQSWKRFAWVWLFLAAGLGMTAVLPFYFDATFGVGPFGRGVVLSVTAVTGVIGSLIGGLWGQRMLARSDFQKVSALLGWSILIAAVSLVGMAWAPNLGVAWAAAIVHFSLRTLATAPVAAILSAVVPARIRGQAFGLAGLYFAAGFSLLPIGLSYGEKYSYRVSLLIGVVPLLIGAAVAFSAGKYIADDIKRVSRLGAAEAEVQRRRAAGEKIDLLEVLDLEVRYGTVQVLFGVDLRVAEGETVALLGTNGAGKSTLLRAVSGLVKPSRGAVLYEGRDVTGIDAEATTALGIVHVPGGRGVFPGMSVRRNLNLGTHLYAGDKKYAAEAFERALHLFPRLGERLDTPAGSLSGGEQQMLCLAQAFMAKPKLLIIDELSLGLAPVVVEDLLQTVEQINADGVAVLLVEQSVNIALSLADRAYFMEKGQVRYEGPAADLLGRDDILRSVFLAGARDIGDLSPAGER
ncbi:MAG TPA: ATP-binding protein [Ilumatobacter sp.]|nr:ATP-binding protein [Ilumatobacter sp.]